MLLSFLVGSQIYSATETPLRIDKDERPVTLTALLR